MVTSMQFPIRLALATVLFGSWSVATATGQGTDMPYGEGTAQEIFQSCLDAPPEQDQSLCIGVMVDNCPGVEGSTSEIIGCLAAEQTYWDERLTQSYDRLLSTLETQDAEVNRPIANQLVTAQQEWVSWRNRNCGFQGDLLRDGSIASLISADCQLAMTADRVFELEGFEFMIGS